MPDVDAPERNYFHDLQLIAEELNLEPEEKQALALLDPPTRRQFLALASAVGIGATLPVKAKAEGLAKLEAWARNAAAKATAAQALNLTLMVNGEKRTAQIDPRTVLLDALRERMGLTGTKKGCDHGQCGACTVLVEGRRVLSCLTLAAQMEGKHVTTIEGLAKGEELHPMQEAFIEHDAFQCGYCTPGQICSAVGMLEEAKRGAASYVSDDVRKPVKELTDDEIRERMSGNICRCGAYPKILAAIHQAHSGKVAKQTWGFHVDEEETV